MIATITAALMSLYAAVSAQAQNTVRRIHDAAIALHMLDRQMMGGVTRTVVPEIMYREYKALYLELRAADDGGGGRSRGTRDPTGGGGRLGGPRGAALPQGAIHGRDGARPSLGGDSAEGGEAAANSQFSIANSQLSNGLAARSTRAAATKADLRAAVKELMGAIERIGGKVDAAKTETIRTMNRTKRDIINGAPSDRINGPRKPKGERNKQIAAVRKAIRESRENGRRLSILQACRKVWQNIKGGYPSVMALYQYCHNHSTEF